MQNCAPRSDRLLELILFSLRDRGALCALVLASYRVELTCLLDRVSAVFYNKSSSDSTDFTHDLEETIAPLVVAHSDAIDAFLRQPIEETASAADSWGRLDRLVAAMGGR